MGKRQQTRKQRGGIIQTLDSMSSSQVGQEEAVRKAIDTLQIINYIRSLPGMVHQYGTHGYNTAAEYLNYLGSLGSQGIDAATMQAKNAQEYLASLGAQGIDALNMNAKNVQEYLAADPTRAAVIAGLGGLGAGLGSYGLYNYLTARPKSVKKTRTRKAKAAK
jgi:hypothetical protein